MPFADARLRLSCGDPVVGQELTRRADTWARKAGATVHFEPQAAEADIVVIRPCELGAWVVRNDARVVPDDLRETTHPMQWSRLLSVESERLASWANQARAVPLAGEAYLVVYRADRLGDAKAAADYQAKFARPLAPPTTWDEFAQVAEFFTDRGVPGLPAATDPDRLLREFHLLAACHDRQAVAGTALAAQTKDATTLDPSIAQMLAFHHDIGTGQPRLTRPAFAAAAAWLHRVTRCRAKAVGPTDAVAAVASGSAVLAVVSLRELGRLPKDGGAVSPTIGVAALPGSKSWFDPKTGQQKVAADAGQGNFIPYFGAEGWIGIVRERCNNPAAAFDALADLSRLERSTELLSDPTLGFGPFRVEHLDQGHEAVWQRYGFDGKRSRQLADAVRRYADVGLANPVVAPRGPDQADLMAILARELTPVATAATTPDTALTAADAAWRKADAARPADALPAERRQSAGLR